MHLVSVPQGRVSGDENLANVGKYSTAAAPAPAPAPEGQATQRRGEVGVREDGAPQRAAGLRSCLLH